MHSSRERKHCALVPVHESVRGMIRVSFAAAWPAWQGVLELELADPSTVSEALQVARERLRAAGSELGAFLGDPAWESGTVGIFGEVCTRDRVLVAGDRVELYRPLQVDPKQARRSRAQRLQNERGRNPLTRRPRSAPRGER